MGIRNIRTEGDQILNAVCKDVTEINDRLLTLIDDMIDTMYENDGAGIAAPQVGVMKRVIVVGVTEEPIVLINPKLISEEGKQRDLEGCLSVPEIFGVVERPLKVVVSGITPEGEEVEIEGEGFLARALCHELDHLDGILFRDHVIRYVDNSESYDPTEDPDYTEET